MFRAWGGGERLYRNLTPLDLSSVHYGKAFRVRVAAEVRASFIGSEINVFEVTRARSRCPGWGGTSRRPRAKLFPIALVSLRVCASFALSLLNT